MSKATNQKSDKPQLIWDIEDLEEKKSKDLISQAHQYMMKDYWKDAQGIYEKALIDDPENAKIIHYLGISYIAEHKSYEEFKKGVHFIHRSMALEPDNHKFVFNMGMAALEIKYYDYAEQLFLGTLEMKPDYVYAMAGLINVYLVKNEAQKAKPYVQELKKFKNKDERLLIKEVEYYLETCQFEKGIKVCKDLLSKYPYYVNAHLKLAGLYKCSGHLNMALKAYLKALRICPQDSVLKLNLGLTLMSRRKFSMGSPFYRARYRLPKKAIIPHHIKSPVWLGEPLEGKTLFLYREQGYGDMINFIRYVPEVLQRFNPKKLFMACDLRLVPLLKNSFPDPRIEWLDDVEALQDGDFDYHAPLIEAMLNLKVSAHKIHPLPSYLSPTDASIERWKPLLSQDKKLKIGICWAGNRIHENNHNRSMASAHFMNMFKDLDRSQFTLYNLIVGKDEQNDRDFKTYDILDFTGEMKDFDASAGFVKQLDFVITVDTAVAHLAGALGVETWALLAYSNDWRWFEHKYNDTPWYPSMRLLRQKAYKQWDTVVEEARSGLLTKINKNTEEQAA